MNELKPPPATLTAEQLLNFDVKPYLEQDEQGFTAVTDAPQDWEFYLAAQVLRPLDGMSVREAQNMLEFAARVLTRKQTFDIKPFATELAALAQQQPEHEVLVVVA